MNDKRLKRVLQKDFVGTPDPGTAFRLQQAFLLRSTAYRTRQNSFSGFFGWLLSPRHVLAKMALACFFAGFLFVKPALNPDRHLPAVCDSARVDPSRVQDSSLFQSTGKAGNDTVF